MKISFFILNYNGADFLSGCVASFLEAIQNSTYDCQLIVVDNVSTDHSVSLIKTTYPNVRIMRMLKNRVLCSFNDAVSQSNSDIVFLLNNDLKADPFFIDPMVSIFKENEDAFLVTAKSLLFDGSYEGGRSIPFMSYGIFATTCHFPGFEKLKEKSGYTFAAGFGAFHRQRFLDLGGYDDLYLPGRVEDSDLMLRAWKRGWKCYYQPRSLLYHMGGKSFKQRFGERGTMEIAHRNTFLFMWKNMESPRYWSSHLFFLLPRMIWMLAHGHWEFISAFVKALAKLRQVFQRRRSEKNIVYQFSDREIISFFRHGR